MKYTLKIGTVYDSHNPDNTSTQVWGGNFNSTGLLFNNLEDVEKVIELAHPPVWIISSIEDTEKTWHDEEVKVHPLVEETRRREKAARFIDHQRKNELVEKINAQPTNVQLSFGISLKVNIHRSDASFDPKKAFHVSICTDCSFVGSSGNKIAGFYYDRYISSNGRILGKRLVRDYSVTKGLNVGDLSILASRLKEIREIVDQFRKGTIQP